MISHYLNRAMRSRRSSLDQWLRDLRAAGYRLELLPTPTRLAVKEGMPERGVEIDCDRQTERDHEPDTRRRRQ